jgi:hypothetical protein
MEGPRHVREDVSDRARNVRPFEFAQAQEVIDSDTVRICSTCGAS